MSRRRGYASFGAAPVVPLEIEEPADASEIYVGHETACSGTCPAGATVHGLYWDGEDRRDVAAEVTVVGTTWTATLIPGGEDAGSKTLTLVATVGGSTESEAISLTVTQLFGELIEDASARDGYRSDAGITVAGTDVTDLENQIGTEDLVDGAGGPLTLYTGAEEPAFHGVQSFGTDAGAHGRTLETVGGGSVAQEYWIVEVGRFLGSSGSPNWHLLNETNSDTNHGYIPATGEMYAYANNGLHICPVTTKATNLPGLWVWRINGASTTMELRCADGTTFGPLTVVDTPGPGAMNGFRLGGYTGYGQPFRTAAALRGTGTLSTEDVDRIWNDVAEWKYGFERPFDPPIGMPPAGTTVLCTTTEVSATLSIPRNKLAYPEGYPNVLRAMFQAGAYDVYQTEHAGNDWYWLDDLTLDFHASALYTVDGTYLVFAPRVNGTSVWRYPAPARYADAKAAELTFNDHGGVQESSSACANGNEVYAFTREFGGTTSSIYWHRSTDSGASFSGATELMAFTRMHRIGSVVVADEPMAVVWWQSDDYEFSFRCFRWNGVDDFAVNGNDIVCVSGNSEYTREFAVTSIGDVLHIVYYDIVGGAQVLVHRYRAYTDSDWSAPVTVDGWEDPDHNLDPILTHIGDTLYLFYTFNDSSTYVGVYYRTWTLAGGWSDRVERSASTDGHCHYPQVPQHLPEDAEWIPIMYTAGDSSPYDIRFCAVIP